MRELGERLIKSMERINYTITLPVLIYTYNAVEMQNLVWEIKSRIQSGVIFPDMQEEDKWKQYQEGKQKVFKSDVEPIREELITRFMKEGEERFKHFVQDDFIAGPYKAILYSGIVWIWCNFEMTYEGFMGACFKYGGKAIIEGNHEKYK